MRTIVLDISQADAIDSRRMLSSAEASQESGDVEKDL